MSRSQQKIGMVKNKAPADIQITAEQIVRQAYDMKDKTVSKAPAQLITDQEDLDAYKDAAAKRGALTAAINYYRAIFQSLLQSDRQQWETLDIPTLTIWGENDTALGKELTYGTGTYVRDWQIKYIPNCSHWVQQEQPALVNTYIRQFLAETSGT